MRAVRGLAPAAVVAAFLAAAAPAAAERPRPLLFGLNDPHFEDVDPERALRLHKRLGSTIARVGLAWRGVQPRPGRFGWGYGDRVYNRFTRHGIRPVFVLSQAPGWAQSSALVRACLGDANASACQRPVGERHLGAFAAFVREVAARYPRLAAIEVYNEPNLGNFNWQPLADPEHYARVLRTAYDAAKSVRPGLPVISGGLVLTPQPAHYGMVEPDEFLRRMYAAGARGAMDGLGLHPYPGRRHPRSERARLLLSLLRAVRDESGDGSLPLWVTETGYSTQGRSGVSLAQQAEWLPLLVGDLLRARDVQAVLVNTLADNRIPDSSGGYGIAHRDLAPKPVFERLAAVIRRVRDERSAAACRCSRRARRCARRRSRTRACRRARKRCRCIRRWRKCVKRGSSSRRCRRAKRCARCPQAGASGVRCRTPVEL